MKTLLLTIVFIGVALAAADLSGTWQAAVDVGGNQGTPVFTFKQAGNELTGTYKGALGEGPVKGTVDGKKIRWEVKLDFGGSPATVVYTGTLETDTLIKGTIDFAGQAEGTFTAKKQ